MIDLDGSDKIVATTKVSIPQGDGPIEATSVIEAVPNSLYNQCDKIESAEQPYERPSDKQKTDSPPATPYRRSMKLQKEYHAPSAPPMHEINANQKLLLNLQGKQHEFSSRTILRSESCTYCLKRLRFGANVLKCRNCSIHVHPDCKIQLALPCVPKSQGTPIKNGKQGVVSDYAPIDGPMVPGLIVHCVNEVSKYINVLLLQLHQHLLIIRLLYLFICRFFNFNIQFDNRSKHAA